MAGKKSNKPEYPKALWQQWYRIMLRIRRFEEKTLMMYSQQKIRGFCHVYIGQEAVAAGLISAIKPQDAMITGYRQHGLALARGLTANSCMAELFGRVDGCVKGKGGSMHFFSAEHRFFGGNGIVGAQIPIGTGIALAEQYKNTGNLCVTMFGDGAARQGALFESFNMAMTWKLPVLYIVENNGYAMGTSVERTSNVGDLYKIGQSFDMPSEAVDGMHPGPVHEAVTKAAEHIRSGKGPYFLEIKTYRYRGHSVSDPATYRSKEEVEYYKSIDPLIVVENQLLEYKMADSAWLAQIQEEVKNEMEEAVQFAENSPFPLESELYEDNYTQANYPFIVD
ncbi:MAG: pyruvate dehydrogenase (acetyl-transferring) E1 component subunit alpha [Saprospiraceae bacterium]|nr:pyruvate dehydrogenase (acetyl-transferring) E1 component subunit alpha [Saprospiraceae bacterium]